MRAARDAARGVNLYNDPDCAALHAALARENGVTPDCVLAANGSDEALYLAFLAYADEAHPICLPDVTYGYYALFAALHHIPIRRVPLREDFTVDLAAMARERGMIVLANPNAPTGLAVSPQEIDALCASDPGRIVLIDEAYVDFGAATCAGLIARRENLLVVRTFSKSRSMAGARLGYALACPARIAELARIHNAAGLYSVSAMAQAMGIAACQEDDYYRANCARIAASREYAAREMEGLGFLMTRSLGNFLFVRHPRLPGDALREGLARRGVLVRGIDAPRARDYCRISVGTRRQMETMIAAARDCLRAAEEQRGEDAHAQR